MYAIRSYYVMIKKLGFALALVAVMVACQSVEKKQQSWDTAKAKTNGYIAKYPVIAEELKAQLKQAEDAFKLAIEESDEKVKIDKMGDAVEMLRRAPMKTIEDFESQLKKTERIIADIKNEFTSEEFGSKTLFFRITSYNVCYTKLLRANLWTIGIGLTRGPQASGTSPSPVDPM